MKKRAIFKLVKDLILTALLGGFAALMFFGDASMSQGLQTFLTLAVAGLPCGWRLASNIITATSLKGILIKAVIAGVIGSVAIFFVLIGDVIRCFTAKN